MKVKPKEVLINLPIVLPFERADQVPEFAANINTIIHGKVKVKYEELGTLGGAFMGLFYINRNDEFSELRLDFTNMIENKQVQEHNSTNLIVTEHTCPNGHAMANHAADCDWGCIHQ
jgi:Icc-related predicted phosphoesterase